MDDRRRHRGDGTGRETGVDEVTKEGNEALGFASSPLKRGFLLSEWVGKRGTVEAAAVCGEEWVVLAVAFAPWTLQALPESDEENGKQESCVGRRRAGGNGVDSGSVEEEKEDGKKEEGRSFGSAGGDPVAGLSFVGEKKGGTDVERPEGGGKENDEDGGEESVLGGGWSTVDACENAGRTITPSLTEDTESIGKKEKKRERERM